MKCDRRTRCSNSRTGYGPSASSASAPQISFRRWEKHGAQSQPAPFPPITAPRGIQQGESPRNLQRPINHAGTSPGQSIASSTLRRALLPTHMYHLSRRRAPPPALKCPGGCSATAQVVQSTQEIFNEHLQFHDPSAHRQPSDVPFLRSPLGAKAQGAQLHVLKNSSLFAQRRR